MNWPTYERIDLELIGVGLTRDPWAAELYINFWAIIIHSRFKFTTSEEFSNMFLLIFVYVFFLRITQNFHVFCSTELVENFYNNQGRVNLTD